MGRPIWEILEEIMAEREMSIPDIARACNLADATIRAMIVRKSKSPALEVAAKLSAGLGITLEYLSGDAGGKPFPYYSISHSPSAQRIARLYDRADDRAREIVDFTLKPFDDGTHEEYASELVPDLLRPIPQYDLPAAAGSGEFLDGDSFEVVEVDGKVPLTAHFGVRISGDSMEPDYPDGWIAWARRSSTIEPGQVGIFILNNAGYIKKMGRGELISLNPSIKPIQIREDDDLRVSGIVVGITEDVYKKDPPG